MIEVRETRIDEPFYTPSALAKKLNVSERTMRTMLKRGDIDSYKVGGLVRIDPEDVAVYLERHRNGNGNGR